MKKTLIAVSLLLLVVAGCESKENTDSQSVELTPTEEITE